MCGVSVDEILKIIGILSNGSFVPGKRNWRPQQILNEVLSEGYFRLYPTDSEILKERIILLNQVKRFEKKLSKKRRLDDAIRRKIDHSCTSANILPRHNPLGNAVHDLEIPTPCQPGTSSKRRVIDKQYRTVRPAQVDPPFSPEAPGTTVEQEKAVLGSVYSANKASPRLNGMKSMNSFREFLLQVLSTDRNSVLRRVLERNGRTSSCTSEIISFLCSKFTRSTQSRHSQLNQDLKHVLVSKARTLNIKAEISKIIVTQEQRA
ncbi:hypothetical protein K469DRAFT_122363 [Zopfia rhizophila CBS 207.26]|uniref:Uncharacterized protein n=1 Tax=Zopfia rhizophila CBS 207.26 TaxID=1314779 RepID=A0A6A6E534_9PEZI|nr:hypothetical protein K469DRAFT_122363 [Zopfia rhizophila CBS 207.26]